MQIFIDQLSLICTVFGVWALCIYILQWCMHCICAECGLIYHFIVSKVISTIKFFIFLSLVSCIVYASAILNRNRLAYWGYCYFDHIYSYIIEFVPYITKFIYWIISAKCKMKIIERAEKKNSTDTESDKKIRNCTVLYMNKQNNKIYFIYILFFSLI